MRANSAPQVVADRRPAASLVVGNAHAAADVEMVQRYASAPRAGRPARSPCPALPAAAHRPAAASRYGSRCRPHRGAAGRPRRGRWPARLHRPRRTCCPSARSKYMDGSSRPRSGLTRSDTGALLAQPGRHLVEAVQFRDRLDVEAEDVMLERQPHLVARSCRRRKRSPCAGRRRRRSRAAVRRPRRCRSRSPCRASRSSTARLELDFTE